jgi:hypothetical protein
MPYKPDLDGYEVSYTRTKKDALMNIKLLMSQVKGLSHLTL